VIIDINSVAVNEEISERDGMAKGNHATYLNTGKNALKAVLQVLSAAKVEIGSNHRVLDYACGYGRVLRWLQAAFPHAELKGMDIDKNAVASASDILGVDARVLDPSLNTPLGGKFDLIWVGSLFTHLPRDEAIRVLSYLRDHLSEMGVLVFTAHGNYVHDRMAAGEKTYNLSDEGVRKVLSEYASGDFAFSPYPHSETYGIALTSPLTIFTALAETRLSPIYFQDRGWVNHQDVYGCVLQ